MEEGTGQGCQPLVSLVIPCYNEQEVFPALRGALVSLAERLAPKYRAELVLVDDGSRDSTWDHIVEFARQDARVRGIALSRNFGHQVALTCGYDLASGDAVVSLDADLQDPPEVVVEFVRAWEKGADVVFGVRKTRQGESRFKLWTAAWFYRLFQAVGHASAPAHSGDFRLMSKRSLLALRRLREKHRYIRGMVGWIGFRTATVEYDRMPRAAGVTKYPLRRMLAFSLDALVSFSSFPLRLAYVFAIAGCLVVLAYLVNALVRYLAYGTPLVPGWTSLIVTVTLFGSLTLFCLGLVGEYVGRIYDQSKNRPLYLIREMVREGAEAGSEGAPTEATEGDSYGSN